jgi:ParB family chromosome partitioning protein
VTDTPATSTGDATTEPSRPIPMLVALDPRGLAAHPLNIRDNIDVSDLIESVRAQGVLQPPLVASTGDGGWRIVAGHRRIAAAVEAGLTKVACVVREDLATDIEAVTGMLVENIHRADLTPVEQARGYQQLLDLGVPKTKIAKRTGSRPKEVRNALAVVANPVALEAADAGLTLDQALVIAEFDNDADAVEALYAAASESDGDFQHEASRLRQHREDTAKRTQAHEALVATGVTVIDPDDRNTWPDLATLTSLTNDDDGTTPIEPDTHAECPGHAAALDHWNPDTIRYYCTDPAAHGHRSRWGNDPTAGNGDLAEADREARSAERAKVITNNKAWRAAEPVRHTYLRDLISRRRPPAGTLRFVVSEIMGSPDRVGDGSDGLLAQIIGSDAPTGTYGRSIGTTLLEKATEARLPLVLLAQLAADRESTMSVNTWRHPDTTAARWLSWLAATGYVLADIEQLAIDLANPGRDEPDPTPSADDEPTPEPADDPDRLDDDHSPDDMTEPPDAA